MKTFSIPVFDGNHYEHWSVKMKTFLKAIDLWDVVETGTQQEPLEESYEFVQESYASSATATYHEYYSKWMEMKDTTALHLIQNGVSCKIFPWIAYAKSSKEAWELLLVRSLGGPMFQAKKLDDLKKEFNDMTMRGEETIHGFSERVMELVFRMRSCGWNVEDKEVVKNIVSSLPPRFDNVVVEVVERLSISELIDCLLVHEYNMRSVDQESLEESVVVESDDEKVESVYSLIKTIQREKDSMEIQRNVAFMMVLFSIMFFVVSFFELKK